MRRAGLTVLAIASALIPFAGSAAAATAPVSAINLSGVVGMDPASQDQQLSAMEAAGVRLARTDASWNQIEPTAPTALGHTYQFAAEDTLVSALAAHGITWLPVFDYSTPWAQSIATVWQSPPSNDADFAAYAQAVAARYGAHGTFWSENPQLPYEPVRTYEVWNEENSSMFWKPGPDPARYADLYEQTRAAVHAVDSASQVIVGGLLDVGAGQASQFVQRMFRARPELKGNVDGFGLHLYTFSASDALAIVSQFRDTLGSVGEGSAPIDVTELGWPMAAGESWRAATFGKIAAGLGRSNCGIGMLAPFAWIEGGSGGDDYSIASSTGLMPSGGAWFSGLAAASSRPVNALCRSYPAATQARAAIAHAARVVRATRRLRRSH